MSYVLTHTEVKILLSFLFNFLITKKKTSYLNRESSQSILWLLSDTKYFAPRSFSCLSFCFVVVLFILFLVGVLIKGNILH